jgi:hypothetical protein
MAGAIMSSVNVGKQLDSSDELHITVTGRKSGKKISLPVWFVRENNTIFLLPLNGTDTQWYKNLERRKKIMISSGNLKLEPSAKLVRDQKKIDLIVEKLRKKHSPAEVKKYYRKFDAGIELSLV